MDAPLARALLGKPLDAEITVALPAGEEQYLIVGISYDAFGPRSA
jgi:transcription elongation factor GreB